MTRFESITFSPWRVEQAGQDGVETLLKERHKKRTQYALHHSMPALFFTNISHLIQLNPRIMIPDIPAGYNDNISVHLRFSVPPYGNCFQI